jgi:hypothetical protein
MGLNPFATVSDYPSMLNKIALYTFFVSTLLLWLIYWQIPGFRQGIPPLQFKIPETDIQAPASVVILAFAFAFISRLVKLHDRLSDLFGIRRRFDVHSVLLPMASAAGTPLSLEQQEEVSRKREELMIKVFYKYASSSPGKAQIEQHSITMALDQWSWYWTLVEAAFCVFVTALIFLSANKSGVAAWMLLVDLGILWLLQATRSLCAGYARDEVRQILEDPSRSNAVAGQFRAL